VEAIRSNVTISA